MNMAKACYWGDLPSQDLIQLLDLVSGERLNEVFYPVSETKPGIGLFGGWKNHSSHPLHPDYIQPVTTWVNEGPGLLGLTVIDDVAERERQAERDKQIQCERHAERELQAERVGKHWQTVRAKKAFQLLESDANFKKAHAVFEQKRSAAVEGDLYAHPFAEFRFIDSVASTAGWFLLTDGKAFNWPTPDKKVIGKARGHAWAMLDTFDKGGVKLPDYQKQYSLKALLSELADQLDVQYKSGRAAWGGKNRPYRVLVQTLANALRRHFGGASPEIVLSLAAMVGCPFTEKTINNQLNDSKEKHRQALAKALLSPGNNSSKFG